MLLARGASDVGLGAITRSPPSFPRPLPPCLLLPRPRPLPRPGLGVAASSDTSLGMEAGELPLPPRPLPPLLPPRLLLEFTFLSVPVSAMALDLLAASATPVIVRRALICFGFAKNVMDCSKSVNL